MAGAQEAPTIRVPVRLVTIPTLVLSGDDRPIQRLQASDFRVLDNGRRQSVAVDETFAPLSVVLAIQTNLDVRRYLSFIRKTGSVFEDLLAGESGEAAIVTYDGELNVAKRFGEGDLRSTLDKISPRGERSRAIDAGVLAIRELLSRTVAGRSRVLIFIGQPLDRGSSFGLEYLRMKAAQEDVTVFALALPEVGRSFVADTFKLHKIAGAKGGGITLGLDFNYGRVLSAAKQSALTASGSDVFSRLAAATGGTVLRFREQSELEEAVIALGGELRSLYTLSFYPDSADPGYHTLKVQVRVPEAKAFSRPGYWLTAD
jgi:VWFA-related protein